jgi:hypothetical protein
LGGVDLDARNSVYAEIVDPPDGTGFSTYHGGAESQASTAINYVAVTDSGGHECDFNDFHNQWYDSDSGTQYESAGGTKNFGTCYLSWAAWTNGSHTMTDDYFGWSPNTYTEWRR